MSQGYEDSRKMTAYMNLVRYSKGYMTPCEELKYEKVLTRKIKKQREESR